MKLGFRKFVLPRRFATHSPRIRIFVWAAILSLICGAIQFGEPLDFVLHNLRDEVRAHRSDGSVVVIRIDGRALNAVGAWPPPRRVDVKTVDALFALGARRIFFDRIFADPSPVGDDETFAKTLRKYDGRVFLAAQFETDSAAGERRALLPVRVLRDNVQVGSVAAWRNFAAYTSRIPIKSKIGGKVYPSFTALLANLNPSAVSDAVADETFRPDFSIPYESIPSLSLADVLDHAPNSSMIAGKDVIVGVTSPSLGDEHFIPGQGQAPGVFVQVIGAETLRNGIPIDIGWIPYLLFALGIGWMYLSTHRRRHRQALALGGYGILVVVPIILDAWHITSQLSPALVMMTIVVVRAHLRARAARNATSGLMAIDQMDHHEARFSGTLVGFTIQNFAELRSTLNAKEERLLFAEIIRRLRVSSGDHEVMHGDDSFVWKTDLPVTRNLLDHVEGLHLVFSQPINLGERRVDLTIAFGLDADVERDLLNRIGGVQVSASEALAGGEAWKVHDARRLGDADFRLSVLSELDAALENGEIWVAYQPKLSLKERRLGGAEALIRWTHPKRGTINPDQFIPAAEAANRIARLTYFVLETAIRDAVSLSAIDPIFGVAVNLSSRMLTVSDLSERVQQLLGSYGMTPSRLTLEITESAEVNFAGRSLETLHQLREIGVKISIDDYGTKYSTLDYVRQLPASEIKIDQRFTGAVHTDESARIMVKSTIELAHSLGLSVVAEGVELPVTMVALTDMNCDVLQGYLIGKPLGFEKMRRFVSHVRLRSAA